MIENPDEIEGEIVESALKEANSSIDLIVDEVKKGIKFNKKEKAYNN